MDGWFGETEINMSSSNLMIVSFTSHILIKQTQVYKEESKQEQPSSLLQLPVSEEGLEPLSCQDYFEKK